MHAVGPQMYGAQFVVTGFWHVPEPLQLWLVFATPAVQEAATHVVPVTQLRQANRPLHSPSSPQLD